MQHVSSLTGSWPCISAVKLYLTIVRPHLEYACEIWDPYLAIDCQMIESIQKFASRVCLKQWSRNTRHQDMLEFLNMPSMATRRRQRKLCTLYKIINNLSEYPSPPLIPRNPYYLSRSVHCLSFVCPYAHTNQYFYSFFPHTVSLWNNLPYDVVSTVPFSTLNVIFWMYASLSLQLFMHPLLVLFTWQKHFRKKK